MKVGQSVVPAIIDSGTEISVLRPSMIKKEIEGEDRAPINITLQGAFGGKHIAELINISVTLLVEDSEDEDKKNGEGQHSGAVLSVALTEEINGQYALISEKDFQTLQEHEHLR